MTHHIVQADRRLCVLRLLGGMLDGLSGVLAGFGHHAGRRELRRDLAWLASHGHLERRYGAAD